MPINKVGDVVTYTEIENRRDFDLYGVVRDSDFAIADEKDPLKQLRFNLTSLPTDTICTMTPPSQGGELTLASADSSGQKKNWTGWQTPTLTSGTSTTPDATVLYMSQIQIQSNCTLTGIKINNGATVGTDEYIVALFDNTGACVANSALAGTTSAGADEFQAIPFVDPYAAVGQNTFWIGLYVNGTTDRFRTIPAVGEQAGYAGSVPAQTFGTIVAVTLPTTFTADEGPVGFTY